MGSSLEKSSTGKTPHDVPDQTGLIGNHVKNTRPGISSSLTTALAAVNHPDFQFLTDAKNPLKYAPETSYRDYGFQPETLSLQHR
jgi:hypothetical protein